VTYLHENYAKLPDKRELRKAKLKRALKDKRVIKDE